MGQRYPYFPGGQPAIFNVPTLPPHMPYQSVYPYAGAIPRPSDNGASNGSPPGSPTASQQAAPASEKPAGDSFGMLPGPKDAALGALITMPTVLGLQELLGDPKGKMGLILPGVQKLEAIPGMRRANQAIEQGIQGLAQGKNTPKWLKGWLNEMCMPLATQGGEDSVEQAVRYMEARRLDETLNRLHQGIGKAKDSAKIRKAYEALLTQIPTKDGVPPVNFLEPTHLKAIAKNGFQPALEQLAIQRDHLRQLTSHPQQKKLLRALDNLYERTHGFHAHYAGPYRAQAELSARLAKEGVGPVGRSAVSFAQAIQRVFNGEMMMAAGGAETGEKIAKTGMKAVLKETWQKSKATASSLLGPVFMGAIMIGQSFKSAREAKPGEKAKTFFHDFLGAGIFSFLGWEVGRRALNAVGFGEKVFRSFAASRLPGVLGKIPFIGGITLGGFATEILAMWGFGAIFKKGGEILSDAVFGKPSKESLEGGKKKNDAAPASPAAGVPAAMPVQPPVGVGGVTSGVSPGMAIAPTMAGYARKYQATPQSRPPMFSLTPDEIRRNVIQPQRHNSTHFGGDDPLANLV